MEDQNIANWGFCKFLHLQNLQYDSHLKLNLVSQLTSYNRHNSKHIFMNSNIPPISTMLNLILISNASSITDHLPLLVTKISLIISLSIDSFIDILTKSLNKHAPLVSSLNQFSSSSSSPWFNQHIKSLNRMAHYKFIDDIVRRYVYIVTPKTSRWY